MEDRLKAIAAACLRGAEDNSMTFPEIVGRLTGEGFESYVVDFERGRAVYRHGNGQSAELPIHAMTARPAPAFDTAALTAAIREAQQLVPGYSYRGFCEKATGAGCAFYMVSFPGRRALYVGRTAETHVEHFPR